MQLKWLLTCMLVIFNWMARGNDSIAKPKPLHKHFICWEGGYSINYASLISLNGTTPPDYARAPFSSFNFGIGYSRLFHSFVASVHLRRVSIGDRIVMNSFPQVPQMPPVFIQGHKNNFILGLSGGYQFRFKKLVIQPSLGLAVSLNPAMDVKVTASVMGGNDTIFMQRTMQLKSNVLMLVNSQISLHYPVQVSAYNFIVGLTAAYALGLSSGYLSETTFKLNTHHYQFKVTNKGTHVIYAIQLIFPLDNESLTN